MKLLLRPVAFDFEDAQGNIMGTAVRLPDGRWIFRHLRYGGWVEESTRKLEPGELLAEYEEMRRRHRSGE